MSNKVVRIKSDNRAPGVARHELETIRSQLGDRFDDAALVVSELISNSVRHARRSDTIELRAETKDEILRLEVRDDGPGFDLDQVSVSGFGLALVDKIATSWGVEDDGRFTVWVELTLSPSPAGDRSGSA